MSGLHIAGDKETEIAIFENVFVDIGDIKVSKMH